MPPFANISRVAVMIFTLLFSTEAISQLQANFKSDVMAGCSPLVVRFQDLSTGAATLWKWDLGNGSISQQQHPTATYFIPGTYSVKLLVKNSGGADSLVKQQYVTVYANPIVAFQVSDSMSCSPKEIQFSDRTIPGSGIINKWTWDFGDGNVSQLQSPLHVYSHEGNYTVKLKVTNSHGCDKTISRQDVIQLTSVKAKFSTSATAGCVSPASVKFTNASIGASNYLWDFGDGSLSTLADPLHQFPVSGTYNVMLIAGNGNGCIDTLVQQVIVGNATANFSVKNSLCVNEEVIFQNTSSVNTSKVFWNFGEGTTSASTNPHKVFTSAGIYNVRLIADFGGCTDTMVKSVTVHSSPVAAFVENGILNKCSPNVTVSFTNNTMGGNDYLWYFGDGAVSGSMNPTHTYKNAGIFSVSLKATNAFGCADSITKADVVKIVPLKIKSISGAQYRGCTPYTAKLSAVVESQDPVVAWLWNFGDGSTSSSQSPSHKFSLPGKYQVKLVITSAGGCKDSMSVGYIEVSNRPQAAFNAFPPISCASGKVQFTNTSSGAEEYLWSFGDGSYSTDKNPIHQYGDTGVFSVKLIAGNTGCYDTVIRKDYVRNFPPIGRFRYKQTCENPYNIQFRDSSTGGQRWKWYFGDGDSSTLQHPTHLYKAAGTYTVLFYVYHDSCFYQTSAVINVIDENPALSVAENTTCKNANLSFTSTNHTSQNIASYQWEFGDGNNAVTQSPTVTHKYFNTGSFLAKLITTDIIGCKDTITMLQPIMVFGPTASFTNYQGGCVNGVTTFNDASKSDGKHAINKWEWSYGDGSHKTFTQNAVSQHSYSAAGDYIVQLLVTDRMGCTDLVTKTSAVQITKPTAVFVSADSVKCSNNEVKLRNRSAGLELKYSWNFGDGAVSVEADPLHKFSNPGLYNIKLIVTDKNFCSDSIVHQQVIANPVAAFIASDTFSSCPPLLVNLSNRSKNFTSYSWDFGNGSKSVISDPSHYYTEPGVYKLKLHVQGYGNCKDSALQVIRIQGPSGSITFSPKTICANDSVTLTATTSNTSSFIWDLTDGTTIATSSKKVKYAYDVPGYYQPRMILVDSAGCQVPITSTDTLKVLGVKAKIGLSQRLYCDSAVTRFIDSSIIIHDYPSSYKWSFGDGSFSSQPNPVHHYRTTGNYKVGLIITTINGCSDSVDVPTPVTVVKSPQIGLSSKMSVCAHDTIQLFARSRNADTSILTWNWDFGGSAATVQNPIVSFKSAGTSLVSATATNASGCSATANLNILVHPLPNLSVGTDTMICRGQSYTLKPTGAVSYAWKNDPSLSCASCSNPVATPQHDVLYSVSGFNEFGCKSEDSIRVRVVQPFTMNVSKSDTLCAGEKIQLRADGAAVYKWYPSAGLNNDRIANPVAEPAATTNYMVVGSDKRNCFSDTGYVKLSVFPVPQFNIVESVIPMPAGSATTIATTNSADIIRWKWYPAKDLSCTDCPQPVLTAKENITYKAEVWNEGGCTASDRVSVSVICDEGNVFIPNTFSPNGDGMNDVFYVRGKGIHSVRSMKVFNRWGEMVFEKSSFAANDHNAGWNGIYKSSKLTPDVYVYIVDVVCSNNAVFTLKGNVTLIR